MSWLEQAVQGAEGRHLEMLGIAIQPYMKARLL